MPVSPAPPLVPSIDKTAVRAHFRRAEPQADFLAREVDQRMQERLDYVKRSPTLILDLGCGAGLSRAGLLARYPGARWLGVDCAQTPDLPRPGWKARLLGENRSLFLVGDAESLPLRSGVADLVWANLLLPWLAAPLFFAECLRCLKPGGLLMFSALGPDTLKELRGGWQDGYAHTQAFPDLHDLGDLLFSGGFADPVMDMEMLTLTYTDLDALLADLRASGATCAMQNRRRGLAARSVKTELVRHYESWRTADGRLPATVELLYGHAWKPIAPPPASDRLPDGRAVIHLTPRGKPRSSHP